jgi:hypothetical protein
MILVFTPVNAGLFCGELVDGSVRETTTQHADRIGRRDGALLRVLRETKCLEGCGLGVKDLPFVANSIRIGHDRFTITRQFDLVLEIAHKAITVGKIHLVALHNQYRNTLLLCFDLDALAHDQMHIENMLLVGELRMRELKS